MPKQTVERHNIRMPKDLDARIMQEWGRRIQRNRGSVSYTEVVVDLVRRGLDTLTDQVPE